MPFRSNKVIMFLILSTAVFTIASFAIMLVLSNRPDPEETTNTESSVAEATPMPLILEKLVGGTSVKLQIVPEEIVQLVSESSIVVAPSPVEAFESLPSGEVATTQGEIPTPTSEVFVPPTPTPIPIVVPTLPPATAVNPIITVPYVVQAGDTLSSIARNHSSTVSLMAAYGIDSGDMNAGTTINLPIANPAYCPGQRTYIIKEGDTVYTIAIRLNVSKETLRQINNLNENYDIQFNQVLCFP